MLRVDVRYTSGVKFEADARGHRVWCDQPIVNGGSDTGMTPPEFLLAALGTCAGYYAVEYLKVRGLPTVGVEVKVEAEKAGNPARLGSFHIEVTTAAIETRHLEGIIRAVKKCLIHNTLLNAPDIDVCIKNAQAPAVAA